MRKTITTLLLALSLTATAKVKLSPLFTDNMVLQQQTDAPIWGEASPGKKVVVTTSWNGRHYVTTADAQGQWMLSVATPTAGGPYDITVTDGKKLVLHDVMIGEVWLCSGQSNMEMPMEGWTVKMNADEIAHAEENSQIRLLHVNQATSPFPETSFSATHGGWTKCTPATLRSFSATAFFFGRHIAVERGVPVGLIMTCWGGTTIEAWTSRQRLGQIAAFRDQLAHIATLNPDAHVRADNYRQAMSEWTAGIGRSEGSYDSRGTALWAQPGYADQSWQQMSLPTQIEKAGMEGYDGILWFRRTVDIPQAWAGKPLTLSLAMIDDNDITYFNGEEIGRMEGYNQLRRYEVPGHMVKAGKAVITVRCMDTGGEGGIWGEARDMSLCLKADATQTLSLAGAWRVNASTRLSNYKPIPVNYAGNPNVPTSLFNAMIKPLVPYAIKGTIWYQGEANAERAFQYRDLMPNLIADWRAEWNKQFPFLFVQLANFQPRKPQPGESEWAELREAQLMSTAVDQTAMAVTIDIGDANDIHPTNKQEVGRRLGLAARHVAYGESLSYSGPTLGSYVLGKGCVTLTFDHADGGLKARGEDGQLHGFAIAGVDHVFHWAEARIEGNRIVVSSPEVPMPVAVRYGWADNPDCNLYNGSGLPASPFRTDEWPGRTVGRQ